MASEWSSLPTALNSSLDGLEKAINDDPQFNGFTDTKAMTKPVTFGIQTTENDDAILITAAPGKSSVSTGSAEKALFSLMATPHQWESLFQAIPKRPYQSFGGIGCHVQILK
ncbi:MAG: hypothetical protein Q9227_001683 [Pyrenula ochraceoflavens]